MKASEIREARLKMGLTQEKFASLVGVNSFTIHRWEKGQCKPSLLAEYRLNQVIKKWSDERD